MKVSFVRFFLRNGTKFPRLRMKRKKKKLLHMVKGSFIFRKKKKISNDIIDTAKLLADLKVTDVATTSRSIELENGSRRLL